MKCLSYVFRKRTKNSVLETSEKHNLLKERLTSVVIIPPRLCTRNMIGAWKRHLALPFISLLGEIHYFQAFFPI